MSYVPKCTCTVVIMQNFTDHCNFTFFGATKLCDGCFQDQSNNKMSVMYSIIRNKVIKLLRFHVETNKVGGSKRVYCYGDLSSAGD